MQTDVLSKLVASTVACGANQAETLATGDLIAATSLAVALSAYLSVVRQRLFDKSRHSYAVKLLLADIPLVVAGSLLGFNSGWKIVYGSEWCVGSVELGVIALGCAIAVLLCFHIYEWYVSIKKVWFPRKDIRDMMKRMSNKIADPGDGGKILANNSGVIRLNANGYETRALAPPASVGQTLRMTVSLKNTPKTSHPRSSRYRNERFQIRVSVDTPQQGKLDFIFHRPDDRLRLIAAQKQGQMFWRIIR